MQAATKSRSAISFLGALPPEHGQAQLHGNATRHGKAIHLGVGNEPIEAARQSICVGGREGLNHSRAPACSRF